MLFIRNTCNIRRKKDKKRKKTYETNTSQNKLSISTLTDRFLRKNY